MHKPVDQAARQEALDVRRSFIVQAPAGSGKTELLIQRFLRLLVTVQEPEQVVAITFTRKAANEMRQRVLLRLQQAAQGESGAGSHLQTVLADAAAVLTHSAKHGWELLYQAQRLQIRTIDSLSAHLARQMPLLSSMGGQLAVVDDASKLYREAILETFRVLEDDPGQWAESTKALQRLLLDYDNHAPRLMAWLTQMLQQRDQWLRQVGSSELDTAVKEILESSLRGLQQQQVQQFVAYTDDLSVFDEICALARYAAQQIPTGHAVAELGGLSGADLRNGVLSSNQAGALASIFLTAQRKLRKKIDKRSGFPADSELAKDWKLRWKSVIERFDSKQGLIALESLADLPPEQINSAQWQRLQDILRVSQQAVAELYWVFAKQGQIDHIGVMTQALTALGSVDRPSALAMRKDQQIQHLLVDEFQDTSRTQLELLHRLIVEWTPDSGRTLFLVGDPMQSIYRFREADVGIFLQLRSAGVFGQIPLHAVSLQVNFRAAGELVEWVNETFSQTFPAVQDVSLGAVTYAPSRTYDDGRTGAVSLHWLHPQEEAAKLASIVEALDTSGQEIAVLVRARSHLPDILSELRRRDLSYEAVEIDSLAQRQVSEDLMALSRALYHLADDEAWFACLQAPWCGLTLSELHGLFHEETESTVWQRLQQADCGMLEAHSAALLERFIHLLGQARIMRSIWPAAALLRYVWQSLGGAQNYPGKASVQEDAEVFFAALETIEPAAQDYATALSDMLTGLFAQTPFSESARVKVMTIHKAKGLEFDHVLLPGMHRRPQNENRGLLKWQEISLGSASGVLMAPLQKDAETEHALYDYMHRFDRRRAAYEAQRLFYVAVTRARRQLHLFAGLTSAENGAIRAPASGSFLSMLPAGILAAAELPPLSDVAPQRRTQNDCLAQLNTQRLRVLPGIVPLAVVDGEPWIPPSDGFMRNIGNVVHDWLERIHNHWGEHWNAGRLVSYGNLIRSELFQSGIAPGDIDQAFEYVHQALIHMLENEQARWLLSPEGKQQSAAEFVLLEHRLGQFRQHIVDRTFVASDQRWIIDYKLVAVDQQQDWQALQTKMQNQYTDQLKRYGRLFTELEDLPQRWMLYLPLQKRAIEISTHELANNSDDNSL